jgi:ergothioneine biosynthesis protein EgtB
MTTILEKYSETRKRTLHLCNGLEPEDFNLQGAEFTSPVKWHLAHSTWFFEEMILKNYLPNYKLFNDQYAFLFNSYYNTLGERVLRNNRGLLSRPYISEIFKYRAYIDRHIAALLKNTDDKNILELVNLGIQHEQQHQELLQTDIKYSLSLNPINFSSSENSKKQIYLSKNTEWKKIEAGIYEIGYDGKEFCYDNELNSHKVFLNTFEVSENLVTNKEYIDFIEAGGYHNFNYWLDEGWAWIRSLNMNAPLYWRNKKESWMHFTLDGLVHVDPNDFVNHISYYEAMAFAAWKGQRLPTEFEWEAAADQITWGSRWEWTNSAYLPYPGFKIADGAVGEYNGKFMSNQMVLRGASIGTTKGHSRKSYRNFFPSNAQWQFSGIRLVK